MRWSGGVVLFLRIMGPSDDPVLLGLDIVKEGRPLPQDEVRMFLAKPQFSLDHELVVETLLLLPNILVPTKKNIVPSEKQKKKLLLPYHITKKK